MLKYFSHFIFLLICFLAFNAHAGPGLHVTGGGTGVERNGHVYLLDLVEAGVETNGMLTRRSPLYETALTSLDFLSENEKQILGSKLQLLANEDLILATATTRAILAFDEWSFIQSALVPLEVDDALIPPPFVQIAVRTALHVHISQPAWDKMDSFQRAACVLHEALSALYPPSLPPMGARQLTGALFALHDGERLSSTEQNEIQAVWASRSTMVSHVSPSPDQDEFGNGLTGTNGFLIATGLTPIIGHTWDAQIFPHVELQRQNGVHEILYVEPRMANQVASFFCDNTGMADVRSLVFGSYQLKVNLLSGADETEPHLQVMLENAAGPAVALRLPGSRECNPAAIKELKSIAETFVRATDVN